MEVVYKSTLFLSRILFQKHHIHSGLQRTTSLGYPPQLPHRRRQDIHLFIHSFIPLPPHNRRQNIHYSFINLLILLFIYPFIPSSYCTGGGRIFIHIFIHPFICLFTHPFILSFFHSSFYPFTYLFIPSFSHPFVYFLLSFALHLLHKRCISGASRFQQLTLFIFC